MNSRFWCGEHNTTLYPVKDMPKFERRVLVAGTWTLDMDSVFCPRQPERPEEDGFDCWETWEVKIV